MSLAFYFSGGGSATSVLGGAISSAALTETRGIILPDVAQADATAGITHYASIYIKNTGGSTIANVGVYLSSVVSAANLYIAKGIAANQSIASATTAPADALVFTKPLFSYSPLALGSLAAGASQQLWIKRVIAVNSSGALLDYINLTGVEA